MEEEKGKRPRGRPLKRVIGPDELEQIGEMLAEGYSIRQIAKQLGVDHSTIHHHVHRSITPILREPALRGPEHLLNRYEHIYRTCWRKIGEGDKYQLGWLQLAFSVQQEISRLLKYTSAAGNTINILNTGTSVQSEFRRAGASGTQIDSEFVTYLQGLIKDQAEYDEAAKLFLSGDDSKVIDAE